MKKRKKSGVCPNCSTLLREEDNYCPNCGQENDDKRQTFGALMAELIEGFTSIDSRLARSIPSLLFKPGFLSKAFLEGKRQKYLHPVRMFITIVVLYFLAYSFFGNSSVPLKFNISPEGVSGSDSVIVFQNGQLKSLPSKEDLLKDSSLWNQNMDSDTILLDHNTEKFDKIKALIKNGVTDTEDVLDSLQEEKTLWNRFLYSQVMRMAQTDVEDFKKYFTSKLPWIVFSLIPVFALLLKLIYIRKDFLYIDHLIFAFHLHSFYFLTGLFSILFTELFNLDLTLIVSAIFILYTLLAFRNFYSQPWLWTIIKTLVLSVLYTFAVAICSLVMLAVIFIIY